MILTALLLLIILVVVKKILLFWICKDKPLPITKIDCPDGIAVLCMTGAVETWHKKRNVCTVPSRYF